MSVERAQAEPRRGSAAVRLRRLALERVLASLVEDALRKTRGDRFLLEPAGLTFGDEGLALDSIERMELAGRVNRFFRLHETGIEDYLLARDTFAEWRQIIERAWEEESIQRITFTTSGTTGEPKPCTHAFDGLLQEADLLAAHFADRERIVALAPPHHIYGFLFTVLLPDRLDAPVLDARRFAAGRLDAVLQAGDLLVSFPTRWRYLQRSIDSFPEGVTGVTSTAPCPAPLIRQLRAQGLERMTEVYGSSETAGIGLRVSPDEPYRLFDFWSREGEGTDARLLRHWPDGTTSSLLPMDRLDWRDERHLLPAGRRDGAVQVGGTNVFPDHVAAMLSRHEAVDRAEVHLDEAGSSRLAARIWTTGAQDELESALRSWCRRRLTAPERPTSFSIESN